MSEKSFTGVKGKSSSPELNADFESAQRFDKLWVGRLGVYYRDGLRIKTIAYSQMERAFIRVQEVRGRMCCGQATFAYFRMIFLVGGKEMDAPPSENEKAMDEALAAIHEAAPDVPIGV